jgi:hypothetical protein
MVQQFTIFPELPPESAESLTELNEALTRLHQRRRSEIEVTGRRARSKIAWKMETFCEAMLYRIVDLAESAALCWNADRVLGAMLNARAIVETVAVLYDYEQRIAQLLPAEDLAGVDAITMNRTFGSRDPDWIRDSPDLQAVNVITLIDKMNAKALPGARSHYDRLSERCHPNSFGQHQMFSKTDYETGTVTFQDSPSHQYAHAIIAGLTLLWFAENLLDRISALTDQVADVHFRLRPPGTSRNS